MAIKKTVEDFEGVIKEIYTGFVIADIFFVDDLEGHCVRIHDSKLRYSKIPKKKGDVFRGQRINDGEKSCVWAEIMEQQTSKPNDNQ